MGLGLEEAEATATEDETAATQAAARTTNVAALGTCKTGLLIITSRVPAERWYEILSDPTLADAILDPLVRKAFALSGRVKVCAGFALTLGLARFCGGRSGICFGFPEAEETSCRRR